jgi:hypothetical protein
MSSFTALNGDHPNDNAEKAPHNSNGNVKVESQEHGAQLKPAKGKVKRCTVDTQPKLWQILTICF